MDHPTTASPPRPSPPTSTPHPSGPTPSRHFIATGDLHLTPTANPVSRTARGPITYPQHPHRTRAFLERAFLHAAVLYPRSATHLVRLVRIANPPHLAPTFRAALFVGEEGAEMRLVVVGRGAGSPDGAVEALAVGVEGHVG